MQLLKDRYGKQVIVNLLGSSLVGSKEGEAMLSSLFHVSASGVDLVFCGTNCIVMSTRKKNSSGLEIESILMNCRLNM